MAGGRLSHDRINMPTRSSAPSSPSEGSTYYDTTREQLLTYNGSAWMASGHRTAFSTTADILGDGSCICFAQFNNNLTDTLGLYNGTNNGTTFTTTAKFGSHSLNTGDDGDYVDFVDLPTFKAASIWVYPTGGDSSANYIFDFRHDAPNNGRGYLYMIGTSRNISTSSDSTANGATGHVWINGTKLSGGVNLSTTSWNHVVVSAKDGTSGGGTTTRDLYDQGLRLGNRSDGTGEGKSGYFDHMRIFNRTLGQADVDILYNETVS